LSPPVQSVAELKHSKGAVTWVSFSENGYYLATAAMDGVRLWDLRKLVKFKDIPRDGGAAFATFDHSGLYLAVGGATLDVYGSKQDWNVVKTFQDLPKKVGSALCPLPPYPILWAGFLKMRTCTDVRAASRPTWWSSLNASRLGHHPLLN